MALAPGTRLGPYEVLSQLGEGGMGEVYRARDVKLNRDVAIKILLPAVANDPDRLARFGREAQMLAALNHPNIGAIYGFEDAGGVKALVLELVEGPTLADRIARGAIPFTDALPIARQIAEALEAAHEQGIVHRDLKPANIKVRSDGTVKVLDFGLAKAGEAGGASKAGGPDGHMTQSPTLTTPAMTHAGMILGTAAYMSPEQAKGQAADRRSDVWAFGCVLFEMLTGRRAFEGPTVTETLAAVLRGEPDWNALPADLPLATRTLLTRCLDKERSRRISDISTARFVLTEQNSLAGTMTHGSALKASRSSRTRWIAGAAALAVGIIVGATAVAVLRPAREAPAASRVGRFVLPASEADPFATDVSGVNVAISPDGSRIVYTATRGGVPELVTRPLDQLEAVPIAGAEGGVNPFFSPDGRQIGFVVAGEIKRVAVDGGRSATISQGDPTFSGATWGADGTIVFSHDFALFRVAASGGQPEKIAGPDAARDEAGYDRPVILPGGQAVLYTVILRNGQTRIAARPMRGGDPTTVVEGGFGAQYLRSGHLVFAQDDRLMAVRFDATTLRVAGAPVVVEEGVFTKAAEGVSNVASASDGTTVYVSGRNAGRFGRLDWVDRRGAHVAAVAQPVEQPRNLRLSPDGRRLAITIGPPGQGQIWVYDLGGSTQPVKLTFHDHNTFAVWSRDGKQIVFMSVAGSAFQLLSIPSDGSTVQPETVTTIEDPSVPLDWTPDGAALLLYRKTSLWLFHSNDRKIVPWLQTPFAEFSARFSPDGRWVAYTSKQTGNPEIWIRPFPGPGAPVRISSTGGQDPVWSRDGKEVFYTNGRTLMSAPVLATSPDVRVDAPRALFDGGFVYNTEDLVLRFYDVAADGRLLMIQPTGGKAASIVVAQHWDEELKARVPTK